MAKTEKIMATAEDTNIFKKYWNWRKARKANRKKPETFSEIALSWIKTILGAIIVVMIINGLAIASFVVPTGSMENTVMTGDFLFVNKFVYGPSTPQVVPFFNIPLPYYKFPGVKEPEVGDVIVFIYPGNRDEVEPAEFQYFLKRCVAKAGDTLHIINKRIYVNGKEIALPEKAKFLRPIMNDDTLRTFPYGRGFSGDNYGPLRIPRKGDVINLSADNYWEWLVFIQREGHEVTKFGQNIYIDGKNATKYKIQRDYCFGMGDNRDNSDDSRYWGFIPYDNVVGTPIVVYWSWDTSLPLSKIIDKIVSVRWSRIFTLID